jgi:LysR family cys regulon transcriptional activator
MRAGGVPAGGEECENGVKLISVMTLKQLRYLQEIVRQSLSISAAAVSLRTSQPGMSRQIQDLEEELGVPLLVRRRNRIVALTEAGAAVLSTAQRLLGEADNIRLIAADARQGAGGKLVVATSHLHARYTLLQPFRTLRLAHPEVQLLMLQAGPDEIPKLVEAGEADIGVSTSEDIAAAGPPLSRVASLHGELLRRCVIVPPGHALARRRRLSLEEIAPHPMVGYDARSRSGRLIARAFEARGLSLRYVARASDSDVIKAYVASGLGIGIVPAVSLAGERPTLHATDVTSLLPEARMLISLRRDMYLRRHVVEFVQMVSPAWDRAAIRRAMESECR